MFSMLSSEQKGVHGGPPLRSILERRRRAVRRYFVFSNRAPIIIHRGLNMRDGLFIAFRFEEMAEAPLTREIIFHWGKFARHMGVRDLAVNRFFERPDAGLDRQARDLDGPFRVEFPTRRAGRQSDEELGSS